ncbi:MAG: M20/M25/M40 family metallo-hydrolase [Phocaeicola sp.]
MYKISSITLRSLILCTFIGITLNSCMSLRTLKYKEAPEIPTISYQLPTIDTLQAVQNLSKAIQIPTHSIAGKFKDDSQSFLEFHTFLKESYPAIHQIAKRFIINKYSLVFKFEGSNKALQPGLFLAHQDVVPAPDPESWDYPPFSGAVEGGYIYGRGALDMKSTLIALMEAMESMLVRGVKLERDLYFCFGHDEEVPTTEGASKIVEWMQEQQITPAFIIDEGGIMVDGAPINAKHRFALIGTSEKGYMDISITQSSPGGHGSIPSYPTTVAKLAESILKIENKPMKSVLTPALRQTATMAAPYLPFKYKFVCANIGTMFPLAKSSLKRNSLTNALTATTVTPTILWASETANVAPPEAKALLNIRIIDGYTREDVRKHIQKVVGKEVKVTYSGGTDPIPMSAIDNEYYKSLTDAILSVSPQTVNVTYPFIANTDSRYFYPICKNIYRFTPLLLTIDDQYRYHSINERCSIDNLAFAIHFFISCLERMGMPSNYTQK